MTKFNTIFVLFIIFIICISFIPKKENKKENDLVKCIGSIYNRTCIYSNIYYTKGEWYVKNTANSDIKCVAVRSRSSKFCFKPINNNNITKYNKRIEGLTTFISLFFQGNIGHLLFDDLYSVYLSLLKFNYRMNPFNILISRNDSNWRNNWVTRIYERFSMRKLMYESDIYNDVVLIDKLIVGIGHHCQRCVNREYSIAGGIEYKGTWWMRKRMYYVYNITQCNNKYAIIVDNKRFKIKEKLMLKRLINDYKSRLNIIYIDWRDYPLFTD